MTRLQANLCLWGRQTLRFAVSEMKTNLNYLGALGRLRLADRLVEPDLISEWVHHGKCAITLPLVGQGTGDFDFVLFQAVVSSSSHP
jgi:hypothetical protein